jgi:hypothetical protein
MGPNHHPELDKTMKRYQYKLHYLKLETGKPNEEQLIEALNHFGNDGWRLNRLYGEVSLRSLASWKGGVNFLLEKVVVEG